MRFQLILKMIAIRTHASSQSKASLVHSLIHDDLIEIFPTPQRGVLSNEQLLVSWSGVHVPVVHSRLHFGYLIKELDLIVAMIIHSLIIQAWQLEILIAHV